MLSVGRSVKTKVGDDKQKISSDFRFYYNLFIDGILLQ